MIFFFFNIIYSLKRCINKSTAQKNYTSVDPIYNGGIAAALALSGWRGWEFASLGVWVNE
jgi:hypothetical protein